MPSVQNDILYRLWCTHIILSISIDIALYYIIQTSKIREYFWWSNKKAFLSLYMWLIAIYNILNWLFGWYINLGGVGHCYAWQVWVPYFIHYIYIHILDTLCDHNIFVFFYNLLYCALTWNGSPYGDGQRLPFLVHCGASQIDVMNGIWQMVTGTITYW